MNKGMMQAVCWRDVREQVQQHNPPLSRLIDKLDPDDEYLIYKTLYPYGEFIFDKGHIKVPLPSGEYVALQDQRLDQQIRENLGYSLVPMGYVNHNTCEVYVEPVGRIVPLTYFTPGAIFGLWETLDPPASQVVGQLWNVAAGARSVFMLPKITDVASHNKLRRAYKIDSYIPQSLCDHWQIFKQLSQHQDFPSAWHMEVLYFSKKWFEKRFTDPAWSEFFLYLFETAWTQSMTWRNKMYFELIWEAFALEVFNKNLKPNPYIINSAKQLINIASGGLPGFKPVNDDTGGPFRAIQEIYTDVYGLKHYIPTIMQPAHINLHRCDQIVYYSLQLPTLIEYSKVIRKPSSAIADLREIKMLMDTLQDDFRIEEQLFSTLVNRMQCHYFHSESDSFGEIELTKKIVDYDKSMGAAVLNNNKQQFADTSHFLRGCISISLQPES